MSSKSGSEREYHDVGAGAGSCYNGSGLISRDGGIEYMLRR